MINKIHSHKKYKFQIINSTSVSDNSFFPPLRKVQNCIVLKAKYESQRQAGRKRGMWQGTVTVWSEGNHRAEDQRSRSPLGRPCMDLPSPHRGKA